MLLVGETLNIFVLTGIFNINIFFIMKNMNVVVYSNIQNKFASTNLTYNLKMKEEEKLFKIDIKLFFFYIIKKRIIYFQLRW